MGVLEFLFFLIFFVSFPLIHSTQDCPNSICSNSNFTIRFPFSLKTKQPQNCGYFGFNLKCNPQGITLINLPNTGEFFVRDINYRTQEIQLYDPYDCLPRRLFDLNLSNSPFNATSYKNYTFLNCPFELTMSRFTIINCLSNSTNSTLATTSMALAKAMTKCEIIGTLPIPVLRSLGNEDDGFSSDLDGDLVLTWDEPYCGDCESRGRVCGLIKNKTSQEITCFSNPTKGETKGVKIFRIIALSITIPVVTCAFGIAILICCVSNIPRPRGTPTMPRNLTLAAITPVQPLATTATGLDESTIESYTKVVLGESRRLPGPNGSNCPICLSDYSPNETLRCIPECKHCFHAECIDEWLRLNGTCPVCRNSPSPAHIHQQNV